MFKSKKIKEFETTINNLHGHLEYSQSIVREKSNAIEQLKSELNDLKLLIAEDMITKVKVEKKKDFN